MKKALPFVVFSLLTTLQSCMVVGGIFRAGFKMGIYFVLLIFGLMWWVFYKRSNRR